ncbi:MAG: GNAT family N-acetyltransferase [Pseudomonadota bacterium]
MADSWRLADGTLALIRPAAAADAQAIQALVRGLSPETRYQRFFNGVRELAPEWLERFSRASPRSAVTLLATVPREEGDALVAMAQYAADPFPQRCDFALVVADAWQGMGIGKRLLRNLECLARAAGIERIEGEVLAQNPRMLALVHAMGYETRRHRESALYVRVSRPLAQPQRDCSPIARLADLERIPYAVRPHFAA